jgi:hypothetical protein
VIDRSGDIFEDSYSMAASDKAFRREFYSSFYSSSIYDNDFLLDSILGKNSLWVILAKAWAAINCELV